MAFDCQASLTNPDYLISFTLDTEMVRRDHGGFRLNFCALWLFVNFELHDTRHWNYDQNRYYSKAEIEAEAAEYEQQQIAAHNAEVEAMFGDSGLTPHPLDAVEMVAAFANPPAKMTGLKIKRVSKFEADEKAMEALALELERDFAEVFGEHDILKDLIANRTGK